MDSTKTSDYKFTDGLRDGIPIGLGYLSVSFSFGIAAAGKGISIFSALLISMTNLTSAGQLAGLGIIAAGGTLIEKILTQLVINMRYALMSISLTQKLDSSFTVGHRLGTSFGMTDEIFAVAAGKKGDINVRYMYGLILIPFICWSLGTFLGAAAGNILPDMLKSALGIAIYGMFLAIFIPPARKSVGVFSVVAFSAAMSCCFKYIPVFSGISSGFSIIICALTASVLGALIFPKKEEEADA